LKLQWYPRWWYDGVFWS